VKQQTIRAGHMCLFIDGLDEFEGEDTEIASFFSDLLEPISNQQLRMKACLSSRPHNAFQDEFRGLPTLHIHEKTRGDILRYVTSRFSNAKADWPTAPFVEVSIDQLINLVVSRASGVFLWVRLVVNDLLRSLTDRDTIPELFERLNGLPEDLENLYKRMLQQIQPRHIKDTILLLQIIQTSYQPLTVLDLYDASQPFPGTLSSPWYDFWNGNFSVTSKLAEDMSGRIRSRCGGLVEIKRTEGEKSEMGTVQFLHQTVKDFLTRRDTWEVIFGLDNGPGIITAHRSQLSANLRRLTFSLKSMRAYVAEIEECVHHAREVEKLSGNAATTQLRLLDQIMTFKVCRPSGFEPGHWSKSVQWLKGRMIPKYNDTNPDEMIRQQAPQPDLVEFIGWAIEMGLSCFASETIRSIPCLANSERIYELLDHAVRRDRDGYRGYAVHFSVVEAILRNGVNPNTSCSWDAKSTPWVVYWKGLYNSLWDVLKVPGDEALYPFAGFFLPMEAMIQHGADVNAKVTLICSTLWTRPLQVLLRAHDLIPRREWGAAVRYLILHGAWLDEEDGEGITAREEITGNRATYFEVYNYLCQINSEPVHLRNRTRLNTPSYVPGLPANFYLSQVPPQLSLERAVYPELVSRTSNTPAAEMIPPVGIDTRYRVARHQSQSSMEEFTGNGFIPDT
jgi:hypothetical protein